MHRAPFPDACCNNARRMGGRGRQWTRGALATRSASERRASRGRTPLLRGGLALVAAGCLLAACGSGTPDAATHPKSSSDPSTAPASSHSVAAPKGPDCPLTGTPAPGGAVPGRSALAVKVDNYPTARPQTGLTAADIVFEEPVEGGITRLAAVFQCHGTTTVGPVRSARNIDIGILGEFGNPLLVHVGGIQPVIDNVVSSPISDFELGDYTTSIVQHPPGRVAPYDTYTSTTTVWQMRSTATHPPQPVFRFSPAVPTGTAVKSVSIPFSIYSPVVWKYDATTKKFLRFYRTSADMLADGVQNSASNVVVQFVNVFYGPWIENSEGGLEVQANLATNASGKAIVFRNGVRITGQWSRSSLGQPTSFTNSAGQPIAMKPGNTWVELVPTTVNVTTTP
ncbi:MAG TPA: DUF3048 domain-containing protein [Acidimicrobiales bacterium]|nr:DUF3048 domain-containing protein [Acidimicrobiales bacterium]